MRCRPSGNPVAIKRVRRYSKNIPGERVQIDTCKISPGLYQYTAVDDCTRYQLDFLEIVIEEMPFPVQTVQTDRGREFFAYKVQEWLLGSCIKFRPILQRSPHLNGKVERAQRTDLEEFYANVNLQDSHLRDRLSEWQHYYNSERIHGAIRMAPIDRYLERKDKTPYWYGVEANYDPTKERIREQSYEVDSILVKLK